MFKNLIVYCHRVIHRIPEWSFQPTVVTTVRLSSGLCVCVTVCNVGVFARIHGPYLRPVYTGAFFDSRTYGPYIRVSKSAPVYAGRIYGYCVSAFSHARASCQSKVFHNDVACCPPPRITFSSNRAVLMWATVPYGSLVQL